MEKNEVFSIENYNEAFLYVEENEGLTIEDLGNRLYKIVEIPVYNQTNEEISQQRQNAYIERTDPLTLRKLRKQALGEWTTEDEKEYVAQIQAISEQIASEFPYNSEEPTL